MNSSGGRLWRLWAKVGAVGNAPALSTASRQVREAHRPQIHSLRLRRGCAPHSGASEEDELARYGQAFKNRAVARLLPPESAALQAVAREVGVSADTLQRWRADALAQPAEQRSWAAAARLEALITTAALDEAARSAWCREQGVYPQELAQWRSSATQALAAPEEARASPQQTKVDRRRIQELERELRRKDKALAETAALLVLSKKVEAIFSKGGAE
jgi:transposase